MHAEENSRKLPERDVEIVVAGNDRIGWENSTLLPVQYRKC